MNKKIWEVDFDVIGPLTLTERISFLQEKGFDENQFYSDIRMIPRENGFLATITAKAEDLYTAEIVANVYFGKMRDILSLVNDIPIQINRSERESGGKRDFRSRRKLEKPDIIFAFNMAREFEKSAPKLLRAIGWYSKGKLTSNTLDRFLAYWNVIEILSNEYHVETERTKNGVKNKIYQCFLENFGDLDSWELPVGWIDDMYEKRNKIVHGGEDVSYEAIMKTANSIPTLEKRAKNLIDILIDKNFDREKFIDFGF